MDGVPAEDMKGKPRHLVAGRGLDAFTRLRASAGIAVRAVCCSPLRSCGCWQLCLSWRLLPLACAGRGVLIPYGGRRHYVDKAHRQRRAICLSYHHCGAAASAVALAGYASGMATLASLSAETACFGSGKDWRTGGTVAATYSAATHPAPGGRPERFLRAGGRAARRAFAAWRDARANASGATLCPGWIISAGVSAALRHALTRCGSAACARFICRFALRHASRRCAHTADS